MLWKLLDLLKSLNIEIVEVFSDDHYAYHEIVPYNILQTGKKNTQKIERKHLTFRTRLKCLARKTICFSNIIAYAYNFVFFVGLIAWNLAANYFET
jgi:insertion element IS1 protein InsB